LPRPPRDPPVAAAVPREAEPSPVPRPGARARLQPVCDALRARLGEERCATLCVMLHGAVLVEERRGAPKQRLTYARLAWAGAGGVPARRRARADGGVWNRWQWRSEESADVLRERLARSYERAYEYGAVLLASGASPVARCRSSWSMEI
jgi:hypothetical protein